MDPLEARASFLSHEPPYGFHLPLLWGGSFSGPALSADNSVQSDFTDILEAYLSKPRRNRKQMCPQRAPMYSNTGAVTPDAEAYHQHNSCDRNHRPPRTHRNPVSHVAAAAAVNGRTSRATHSTAAAARSSGGNTKKSANPCAGPCDNCGARDSPQWRHGSKSKPIVCNACGIRFLRTGSFDKAVDKKLCGANSSAMSGGARLPKRSRADDSSSMEEDEDEQEDEPHMASRSCVHPAASDGGIHSCADSKAAAAGNAAGSRRVSTPSPEDEFGGMQQQQAGGNHAMSPAVSSASAYSDGAAPSPLNLGPAATPNSAAGGSSRNRAVTSGNSSGRGGQQAGQLRGVVRGPNGRFMSRHGMSPLSNASGGGGASKPSRFGAAAKASATASRLQPAAPAGATGAVVPGSGARVPGGEPKQPAAASAAAAAAAAAVPAVGAAGVPAVHVVQLMMNLVGNLGSTEAAIEFINQQVNSKSGAGGPNIEAAAEVIRKAAAGATVTPGLAGPAASSAAAVATGSACARPASGSQLID